MIQLNRSAETDIFMVDKVKKNINKDKEIDWLEDPYFWIQGKPFKTRNEAIYYIKRNHIELKCSVCKKRCTPEGIDFIFPPIPEYMCKNCPEWDNWVSGVACCLGLIITVLKCKQYKNAEGEKIKLIP